MILAPTTPVSPFPWTEPHAAAINGQPQENYYRWLALTYVTTLTTHPSLSLPCGSDRAGMPFGLQIVGPRGGDAYVLGVAASLEALLADDARTARPVPDIEKLKAAPPISACPNFLGFD